MKILKNNLSNRIILIISLFLLLSITISTVNAAEKNITSSDNLGQTINNATNGDTINLDTGTYTTNVTNITINKNLTITGKDPKTTIIDAQKLGRIFSISGGNTLTLINITLANGNIIGNGGAITIDSGNKLTMTNCILTNNIVTNYGGAIYNNGNFININSSFTNNMANNGGAIYNTINGVNMSVVNASFINNIAGTGGAITNFAINVVIEGSRFNNNLATNIGGAIYIGARNMNISNSNFTNNSATNDHGGAIYCSSPNITIINSNFTNNTAYANSGGAIYNTGSYMIINNTIFRDNIAGFGGGISNSGINTTITNSTFINNTANNTDSPYWQSGGGAIWNAGDNTNIIKSSFSNNTGLYGGAIFNDGFYTNFTNNKFNNNLGANVSGIFNEGNNITISNSTFNDNTATISGAGIYNNAINMNITNSKFIDNSANIGAGIFNNGNMLVSGNVMEGNIANVLGNEIYNNGSMGILNLTYLNNSTVTVNNNSNVLLYAILTDDMGNLVTGQNISFFVDGTFVGSQESIEGFAKLTYLVTQGAGIVPVTGDYEGHDGFEIILRNGQLVIVSNTTVTSEITLDKDEYQINETVQGKITITNTGNNTAANITTRLNFPSNFVLDPSSVIVSHGTFDPTTNIWTIGDLAPGEIATMRFTGIFTTAGEQTISIETSGDNFATSTDSATVLVESQKPPTPTPTPEPGTNQTAKAAMKETGIPIISLILVLLSLIGFGYYRKQ